MSYEIGHCFLCGSVSKQLETDHSHRYLVVCSSPDCGEYEITKTLASEIGLISGAKTTLKNLVNSSLGKEGHYDFMRNTQGQICNEWVHRT